MILVSILGDFHSSVLPVSFEFKEDITKHVIIYDDARQDTKASWKVLRGQQAFLEKLPENSTFKYELVPMQVDEDNYESIVSRFEDIKVLAEEKEDIYLNSTDGLSSIAVILSSKLLGIGAKVISYDRFSNTYNLHTYQAMKKCPMQSKMDILTHITLKGYTIVKKSSKNEIASRQTVIKNLTKDLPRYHNFLEQLLNDKTIMDEVKGYDDYKQLLREINKENDLQFIKKGVFNEYIYHLLVENFDFDDVWVNIRIRASKNVESDFDVVMIKDNHFHTIDCEIIQHSNGQKQIYRMETIIDYLDDDGKSMILSIGRTGKQFKDADISRALYGDIKIYKEDNFDEKAFLKDISQWFL